MTVIYSIVKCNILKNKKFRDIVIEVIHSVNKWNCDDAGTGVRYLLLA